MPTEQKLQLLKSGKLSAEQNVKNCLQKIKKEKELNAFLYVAEKEALLQAKNIDKKKKKGKLAGLTVAVKSNINVIGMPISCASKTLENYSGTFDADVIKKIKAEDGIIIGITNCDEFACGSFGSNSAFGPTKNPKALSVAPGGSSSGSAAAVAAGLCDLSLGSDTGGSIRNPASSCGIVGIKPSYGRVSRYGLIDLSMSLDQIGPFSQDVYGAALLMEVLAGHSDADPTTYEKDVPNYSKLNSIKNVKIGLSDEFKKLCTNKEIYALVEKTAQSIAKKLKTEIKKVSLKYTHLAVQTYYPIVYTEFFSATRRFDGRRYGKKIEDSAGEEVLRRILGGREISRAEHAGQYYRKALATKKLIAEDFNNAFKQVDIIITPTTPDLPKKLGQKLSPEEEYAMDAFTIPANLAGIAAGVIPIGTINNIPVGMQVMVPAFKEELLFDFLKIVEKNV
ncbi:MAG TPA: Asp-tRNA(Asn)/Glu-tRNA(Gln) amidotransferase subunit GatA [Candidatus Nanoarchaeia archaeon]|nr:Asp-tRNA(Asn)/Glu-tRNA(Gln) amidotransferase subunit GatA [Candidatus Nanoarchaeia archaeon]